MNQITIGTKIADGRKAMDLSQAEFADMLSISKQAVGKWERGESMPDLLMLGKIAQILGVDANYFFSEELYTETVKEQAVKPKAKNLSFMSLKDSDFSGLSNLSEKFNYASIVKCKFIGADLRGVTFKGNNMTENEYIGAKLKGSKFVSANIGRNNFTSADLSKTVFKSSNLNSNIFIGAILNETEFSGCNITSSKFSGTLTNCSFLNCNFRNVEFTNVTFDNVFFKGRARGAKLTNCTADKITYAFLKNAKADLSGLTIKE